jgi:hypothetical protein
MTASKTLVMFGWLASVVLTSCAGDTNPAGEQRISGTVTGPVVEGVTVSLSGAATASTATDRDGNYAFAGLANGDYTVTPSMEAYVFSPASQAVSVSDANVGGRDFTSFASTTSGRWTYWDGCTTEECGFPPTGAPNWLCTDGTYGGPGPCTRDANGACGWSLRYCEAVTPCTGCVLVGRSVVACDPPQWGESGPSGLCVTGESDSCTELVMQCFTP